MISPVYRVFLVLLTYNLNGLGKNEVDESILSQFSVARLDSVDKTCIRKRSANIMWQYSTWRHIKQIAPKVESWNVRKVMTSAPNPLALPEIRLKRVNARVSPSTACPDRIEKAKVMNSGDKGAVSFRPILLTCRCHQERWSGTTSIEVSGDSGCCDRFGGWHFRNFGWVSTEEETGTLTAIARIAYQLWHDGLMSLDRMFDGPSLRIVNLELSKYLGEGWTVEV